MRKIIIGILFIIGGFSGNFVLRGTNSGEALGVIGIGLLVWGFIQLMKNQDETDKKIQESNKSTSDIPNIITNSNDLEKSINLQQDNTKSVPFLIEKPSCSLCNHIHRQSGIFDRFKCDLSSKVIDDTVNTSCESFVRKTKIITA
ncbi:MAG: hypothetical protein ABR936_16155 [Bacteroidota bacterium]|jgi:hypothetical protein